MAWHGCRCCGDFEFDHVPFNLASTLYIFNKLFKKKKKLNTIQTVMCYDLVVYYVNFNYLKIRLHSL